MPRRGGENRVPGIGALGDGIDRVVGRFVPAVVQQIDVDEVAQQIDVDRLLPGRRPEGTRTLTCGSVDALMTGRTNS